MHRLDSSHRLSHFDQLLCAFLRRTVGQFGLAVALLFSDIAMVGTQ